MQGLVSIIIPTFNRAHLIADTLDSVLKQTYSHWECIVVDDGSFDDTKVVVEKYVQKDSRFSFLQRPDSRLKGPSSCRNFGFEKSNGEFIQWLDSDDLLCKNKLFTDLKYLQNMAYDFTISQSQFFDHDSKKELRVWNPNLYSEDPINDFIQKKIGWGINSALWRKKTLLSKGLTFNESLSNRNDYFFHLEALLKKLNPTIINKTLAFQREHANRIQNKVNKAPAKAIVNYFLLSNSDEYKFNSTTVEILKKQSLLILIRFYKYKEWKAAIKFSKKLIGLPQGNRDIMSILRLFIFGTFYRISNKGYTYLT